MKTYCFKLYKSARNAKLHKQINAAGLTYNHCIALHNRYYKLFGKYLTANNLKKHLTKLKKLPKFSYLLEFGSQAVQDVAERIDRAYHLFSAMSSVKSGVRRQSLKKFVGTNHSRSNNAVGSLTRTTTL